MVVRRHEELVAWQLAMLLNQRLAAIMGRQSASHDWSFCSELLEAAESVSANIAEGFDRYRLPQFHYFLQIARGSLAETSTRIRHAYERGYLNEAELNELLLLCRRTRAVLTPRITSVAPGAGDDVGRSARPRTRLGPVIRRTKQR